MAEPITTVHELIARTDDDPEFLRLLVLEPDKATEHISDPALRDQLAGLDPRVILTGLIGGVAGVPLPGKCDDTCGSGSCVETCGDRSCHKTCADDSCVGTCGEGSCDGTCGSSCGGTCGAKSCVDTTSRPIGGDGGDGGGFMQSNLDRVRADLDALVAQHLESR